MENNNGWITGLLILAMLSGIGLCLWRITTGSPTAHEALLLSLFLTLLSIIASWIASRYYSEYSYNRNLRVFALKAAEKVTNLSNELDRLSTFIQQELKENEYDSPGQALLAKNIRLEGAIHIINTLKSVNDRSLSDWQGVIGEEEISARREVQEEREETLRYLLERLDSLQNASLRTDGTQHEGEDHLLTQDHLLAEVASLRTELRLLASQISGVPAIPARVQKKKDVQKPCPSCGHLLQYRQRSKTKNVKGIECTKCGVRLCSREAEGDFVLSVRSVIDESVTCPSCGENSVIKMDPVPGTVLDVNCPRCKVMLRVSRGHTGLRTRLPGPPKAPNLVPPLGDEFLKKVANMMGPQPWPKGQSLLVAGRLEVNPRLIGRATQELIRRGVFKPQIDGKLYIPEGLN